MLLCDDGEIELSTPRDRENTFEPQLIKKNQTRITQMDRQILSLYAKGMTTREIVSTFKEMYDAGVSATLISKVTDAVKEQLAEWPNRPLDALYPVGVRTGEISILSSAIRPISARQFTRRMPSNR